MSSLRPGLAAVLGGALAALLFLALQTGSLGGLILFWMAPLPLFLVALSFGPGLAGAASLWAFAMLSGTMSWVIGLEFLVVMAIPVIAVGGAALRGPKPDPGFMLLVLVAMVVTAFAAAEIVNAGVPGGLQGRIRAAVAAVAAAAPKSDTRWMNVGMLDRVSGFIPGISGAMVVLITIGNGVLAQGALARFGWTRWASPRMSRLTMPRWTSLVFGAVIAAGFFGAGEVRFVGQNLAVITAVPIMFGGFAVVHSWSERHPAYWPLVPGLYVLSFLIGGTVPLIVALGLVEQWFGLRRRIGPPGRGEK